MEIGGGVQFTAGMSVTGVFTIPEAPTNITASRNSSLLSPDDPTKATVNFIAPTQPFGVDAQVQTYTATSNPDSITGTLNQSDSGSITVSGLTSTTNYTFTVTATNRAGTSASSVASNNIGSLPLNTVAPAVTGTTTVGQTLTTTTGTWTGSPTPTLAYQWQREGVDISGATSSTYVLLESDAGNTIRCAITATNSTGAVTQNSNTTTAINWMPANTVAPVVSGTTQVGYILSTTDGTWTGYPTPTFTYQWQRAGVNIASATNNTYTLVDSDASYVIRCVVTGTNVLGPISANSNATSAIVWQPINTVAPAVTGTPVQGYTLSTTDGTWTGYPTPTFTYQWQRAGVDILNATTSTYIITNLDLGNTIRCVVTGTNSVTTTLANSNSTAIVSSTPINTVAPEVTGIEAVGETLTTTDGTWTGTPTPTYTYQWQRAGANINSATGSTYTLVDADSANTIRCIVTASNSATVLVGVVTANSNSTGIVTGPPINYIIPTIAGTARLGLELTCTTGSWYGYPTISYAYQWKRDGVNISGQTTNTYTILAGDISTLITCTVTATNSISLGIATTNSVAPTMAYYSIVSTGGTGVKGYIDMASNSSYALSNNCTIEFWIRLGTGIRNANEVFLSAGNTKNNIQYLSVDSLNRIGIGPLHTPAAVGLGAKSVNSLNRDGSSWYHVAVVVFSGNLTLFVNGELWTLTGTTTGWQSAPVATSMRLFNYIGGGSYTMNGTISNMRITDNVLYVGAFTPPTDALTTSTVGTTGANVYNGSLGSDVKFLGLNIPNINNDDSGNGVLTTFNTSFIYYSTSNPFTEIAPGEQVFTTAGTYTWTVPPKVYSISMVAVGGGQAPGSTTGGLYGGGTGGAGGWLAYRNNYSVSPGDILTIVCGRGGRTQSDGGVTRENGTASIITIDSIKIVEAMPGYTDVDTYTSITGQVAYSGGGGGSAGSGGQTAYMGGGGGAGGYSGTGGNGSGYFNAPTSGTGGGGGGSAGAQNRFNTSDNNGGGGGGGVGIYGQGSSGVGGFHGGGGSGGSSGSSINAGLYGGGGGGKGKLGADFPSMPGGGGAVRIIWSGTRAADSARAFPSTLAGDSSAL